MPLTFLKMCSMHLRKGLTTFNLHQCGKELGNYAMGGNFLDRRVPLREELVSEKKSALEGNSRAWLLCKTPTKLCQNKICLVRLGGFLLVTRLMLVALKKSLNSFYSLFLFCTDYYKGIKAQEIKKVACREGSGSFSHAFLAHLNLVFFLSPKVQNLFIFPLDSISK